MDRITIREIQKDEISCLERALYNALYVHNGEPAFPPEKIREPVWEKWYADWGREGDTAFVAVNQNHKLIGAAWYRLFRAEDNGFGFVTEEIPEITISVEEGYQGMGIGRRMMKTMLESACHDQYPGISLNLDARNIPAYNLYRSLGFVTVKEGSHPTMLNTF